MNNEKLIERIRNLYAMSNDTSSPNEAAIAARRVRALMDEHGVTLADLETSEFGTVDLSLKRKAFHMWYQTLVLSVGSYNDVIVDRCGDTLTYKGFEVDAISANLMIDYIMQAMERQLAIYKSDTGATSFASTNSFRLGFAHDMSNRLREMTAQRRNDDMEQAAKHNMTGTALVITKGKMVAEKYGRQQTRTSYATAGKDSGARQAGAAASQRTGLNTQVRGASQKALS